MAEFWQQSPYLDPPQTHHVSDFKYTRYMSMQKSPVIDSETATAKSFPDGVIGMALFGIGRAGSIHIGNLLMNPRVALLYVVEADPARYESFRARWGARMPPNVLPDNSATVFSDTRVSAVLVATPTFTHRDIIQNALQAGKMVFSEKPVAENEAQTRLCYRLAAEKGLSIFCAFNRRFDPAYQAIHKAVKTGEVGVVHRIKTVARDSPLPSLNYLKISGGIFHDCAVHDIDLICWILGEYPTRVFACAHAHIPEIAAIGDHDTVAITMEFASGTIGTVDISRNAVYGYDQRLEVFGPKGMLIAGNERPMNIRRVTATGDSSVPIYHSFASRFFEGYSIELDSFLDHVQGKIPLPILPEDSLKVSRIASACEESVKTRAFVDVTFSD